ncbi:TonB-dependent receptor [Sphingobium sufflavum]|uniref:TonB-dependent receptor n=1 Tax=Sphingobium sufflavum TaxID=1129547 RepID=UPI001F24FD65|nr:TonB-dependent receptor [Sphingobium sufflavum]MCE7796182.1 TonB-dependent receptor [Sphingobium sufflavum]
MTKTILNSLAAVHLAGVAGTAIAMALATGASAQQTSTTTIQNDAADILVTGQRIGGISLDTPSTAGTRLGLTALETPASVAVLSGDMIRDFGYQTIADATSRAPGISSVPFPGTGNNALSTRGFYGVNSITQTYDGMQLYNAGGVITFPFDPWNVERVEILYGPASVLYGAGAIGGAVNVVSKKPDTQNSRMQSQFSLGSWNSVRVAADVTGPLSDRIAYRANVSYNRSDGWMDRGRSRSFAASAALRFQLTDTLSLSIVDDYGDNRPTTYEGTPLVNGAIDERFRRQNYNAADARIRFEENRARVNVEWTPSDSFSFRSDAYAIHQYREYFETYTYAYVPAAGLLPERVRRTQYRDIVGYQHQFGDHGFATLKSGLGRGVDNALVVGFDINHNRYDRRDNGSFPGSSTVPAFGFNPGSYADGTGIAYLRPQYIAQVDQLGFFAQDRVTFGETLSLVAGVRWDQYRMKRTSQPASPSDPAPNTVSGAGWNVGIVYNPVPTISLYAQYATANDPVTSLASISASQILFDLSPGRQFEVGAKGSHAHGALEWTLAAYRIVKKDLLVPVLGNLSLTEQVGQQSSKGIEASVAVRPVKAWTIVANGAILNAKFDDFFASVGGVRTSLAGLQPQFVPEEMANVRSTIDLTPALQLRGEWQYVGRRFTDNSNTFPLPAYDVTAVGARWLVAPQLKLDLRVDNVFDTTYAVSSYAGNGTQVILGAPRSVTGTLSVAF